VVPAVLAGEMLIVMVGGHKIGFHVHDRLLICPACGNTSQASKVMMAWMPADSYEAVLREVVAAGALSAGTGHAFTEQLAQVRSDEYAMSVGETVKGASVIAAPLLDSTDDQVAGAINVTGSADRFRPSEEDKVGEAAARGGRDHHAAAWPERWFDATARRGGAPLFASVTPAGVHPD